MAEDDRSLLLTLLTAHYEELTRYLARLLGSAGSASEAVHDTYLRLQRLAAVPDLDNPRAYLFRVASNIALDQLRARRADERRLVPDGLTAEQPSAVLPADIVMEQADRLRLLARAIDELPPRCREVFLLHKIEGLGHAEVARRLGISRSMVEKHVMKALAHCRDRLIL